MAFPVIKYCLATREEELLLGSEDDTGEIAVGDVDMCLEAEGEEISLDFEEDDASAKSSGRFKARRTSTISS